MKKEEKKKKMRKMTMNREETNPQYEECMREIDNILNSGDEYLINSITVKYKKLHSLWKSNRYMKVKDFLDFLDSHVLDYQEWKKANEILKKNGLY